MPFVQKRTTRPRRRVPGGQEGFRQSVRDRTDQQGAAQTGALQAHRGRRRRPRSSGRGRERRAGLRQAQTGQVGAEARLRRRSGQSGTIAVTPAASRAASDRREAPPGPKEAAVVDGIGEVEAGKQGVETRVRIGRGRAQGEAGADGRRCDVEVGLAQAGASGHTGGQRSRGGLAGYGAYGGAGSAGGRGPDGEADVRRGAVGRPGGLGR